MCHYKIVALFREMIRDRWRPPDWIPGVDVVETADTFELYVDLPGIPADQIHIFPEDDGLLIEGCRQPEASVERGNAFHRERPMGVFCRTVRFQQQIRDNAVHVDHRDGVCIVTIDK